jgi:uncharacterized protein (TIGR03435 family)
MRTLSAILLVGLVIPLFGQGPAASFDVASIRPSAPGTRQRILIEPGGRFLAEGVSLKLLIASAWQLAQYQMSGGETWTASEPWTVQATADGITVPSWSPPFLPEIIAARVRSLVSDRFALQIHHETRELAVYRLSISKNGPKLKVTQSPEPSQRDSPEGSPRTIGRGEHPEDVIPAPGRAMAGPGTVIASAIPMQQLITLLGRWMERPIIDKTGLTGYVDVRLRFAPETAPRPSPIQPSPDGAVPSPSDDPSIFTAVEEQLGLKLEPAKEPVDVLVIDSARKPLEN